jgi:hypothetical protein
MQGRSMTADIIYLNANEDEEEEDEWDVSWADGVMTIWLPEEDALEIEARAKEAGVSVEIYVRRKFGFPDEPRGDIPVPERIIPHAEMAHVRFFAETWGKTPNEVLDWVADYIERLSFDDIRYMIAQGVQQSEKLLRRKMAMKENPFEGFASTFAQHALCLLIMGELAEQSRDVDLLREVAKQAETFADTLNHLRGMAAPAA